MKSREDAWERVEGAAKQNPMVSKEQNNWL